MSTLHQWSDAERQTLNELERDLGSAEISAVLSEWVATQIHRAFATTSVLGCWRNQLIAQGWSDRTAEAALPLILDRIWPIEGGSESYPFDVIMDQVASQVTEHILRDDDDDDETED